MAEFKNAHLITARNEGGWHNGKGLNKFDRGGETFKGIARKIWPNWKGWDRIDLLKQSNEFPRIAEQDPLLTNMVHEFFKENFWDRNRLSEIHFQPIANELYDTGVNFGTVPAAKMLQQALNLLNRNQDSWQDIKEDGVIGPLTLRKVNGLIGMDRIYCFNVLNILQGESYINIMRKDKTQENNLRGWLSRVELMR